METWHYQQTIKDCKPFIFDNYGCLGQTANLAMKMFEAELIQHETWQYATELLHEKERLNYLLNQFLDPSYKNVKTAFDFLVKQFNTERYPNISKQLTVTLEKVKTYQKPPEEPILEHLDRLHDNLSDLTPNQLKESVKKIRAQIVTQGFEKDAAQKQENVGVTYTDSTSEEYLSTINIRDSEGKTALMWAVERGDISEMSELFDCQNLDLTVYDHSGLTFEYHVFGNSILKYMYIDKLKYSVPMLNFYEKLKDDKSNLHWDKIMTAIEFLLAKENVNKTHLLKSCIMFGNESVMEMVLETILKTVVITKDIKDFVVDITQTINPIVVKFLSQFEISLNTSNVDAIMYSVIRYNCPDTSLVLLDHLALKVDKALKTVLCLQSIPPGVLSHIPPSTFNLNEREKKGNPTVFTTLCRFGSYEIVSKLVEQTDIKIDFKARDRFGYNCFMRALMRHTEDISLLLLQNPKLAVIIKSIITTDDKRIGEDTLLIEASRRGHVNSASLILDYGANLNTVGRGHMTALMEASRLGQEAIVEKILSIGTIDVHAVGSNTNTQTALHEASIMGHGQIVNLLIKHWSTDINAKNHVGLTALHYACIFGYEQVVTHLITHDDIQINAKDNLCETALHKACWYGHDGMVSKLIGHSDVDINAQNCYSFTPLYVASSAGNTAVVAILITQNDTDVNTGDIYGDTPLHTASSGGHEVVVSQLLNHTEINVNAKNKYGYTALHAASFAGHTRVVSRLTTRADVQIHVQNNDGETAGQVALRLGHNDIASQLMTLTTPE